MDCGKANDRAARCDKSDQKARGEADLLPGGNIQSEQFWDRQGNDHDIKGDIEPAVGVSGSYSINACSVARIGILPCVGKGMAGKDHRQRAGKGSCG